VGTKAIAKVVAAVDFRNARRDKGEWAVGFIVDLPYNF